MDKINEWISVSGKLTVFFEDPFWVGVFELKQQKRKEKHRGR